jgi:ABC-type Fe3+/spermidine/putrescine transport system ATPase subunit
MSDRGVPALGLATSGARDGTAVIRPEDLVLGRADDAGAAGTVSDVSFQGARQRVLVTLAGGERLIVSAPVQDGPGHGAADAVAVRTAQASVHAVAERTDAAGRPLVAAAA